MGMPTLRFVFVFGCAQKIFGVMEGVGMGLAVVEVGWRDPFGVAVGAFAGGPAPGFNQ